MISDLSPGQISSISIRDKLLQSIFTERYGTWQNFLIVWVPILTLFGFCLVFHFIQKLFSLFFSSVLFNIFKMLSSDSTWTTWEFIKGSIILILSSWIGLNIGSSLLLLLGKFLIHLMISMNFVGLFLLNKSVWLKRIRNHRLGRRSWQDWLSYYKRLTQIRMRRVIFKVICLSHWLPATQVLLIFLDKHAFLYWVNLLVDNEVFRDFIFIFCKHCFNYIWILGEFYSCCAEMFKTLSS